ncbi:MAG: pitrilysin family protein [Bacteroidales bacterium]|nr:pitrilysin family protein [Bacteroidales bacterium]
MQLCSNIFANGLRLVHAQISSPVSYCGFTLNVGTRDELSGQSGMAHFVEHLLFKGTTKRKAFHILNRMDNVGGELNAFTTKEETVIYSVFMDEHMVRAMDLLVDVVFNSIVPDNEFDKEREVILDEIRSYQDNPSEQIFDDFENIIFKDHQLGCPILGSEESLQSFSPFDCRSFIKMHYTPDKMVFFYLGKTSFDTVCRTLDRLISGIDFSGLSSNLLERKAPVTYVPAKIKKEMETYQSHVIIGGPSYGLFDDKRRAFYLLNNYLGGPCMNSLLNISLREKKGLVYTVESSVSSFTDTGAFAIYFGTDPKNMEQCISLVNKELKMLRTKKISGSKLHIIQQQLIGQICISSDNHENLALGIGKSYLHVGHYESLEEICKKIEKITSEDLFDIANEVYDENKLSSLIFV